MPQDKLYYYHYRNYIQAVAIMLRKTLLNLWALVIFLISSTLNEHLFPHSTNKCSSAILPPWSFGKQVVVRFGPSTRPIRCRSILRPLPAPSPYFGPRLGTRGWGRGGGVTWCRGEPPSASAGWNGGDSSAQEAAAAKSSTAGLIERDSNRDRPRGPLRRTTGRTDRGWGLRWSYAKLTQRLADTETRLYRLVSLAGSS